MKKIIITAILVGVFLLCSPVILYAQEDTNLLEDNDLLENIDFTDAELVLDDVLGEDISFEQMVRDLIKGKMPFNKDTFISLAKKAFLEEIENNWDSMIYILILAILASVFTNFTKVFEKSQVADISFYIIYLLLLAILIKSFCVVNSVAETILAQMTEFMKVLMPTYFLTVAVSNGGTTAVVFYEFLLFLIYGINWVLLKILLPVCNIYVVLSLVNYISQEDLLSRMADLLKQLVGWGLKTLLAVVIGLNAIQGLIAPAVDSFKSGVLHKTVSAIPGVGNTMNAVTEVVIGSSVLIKNSVGAGILIVLAILSMIPLLKLFVFMFLYKLTAAVIQPIADKRMVQCISTVGEGARLLMRCVSTAVVLFFITIAILTVSTNIR